MSEKRYLVAGSLANGVRGLTAAGLTAAMPLYLVGVLRPDAFSVWALALGLANLVLFLDLGMQQAVTAASSKPSSTAGQSTPALTLAAALQILWPLLAAAAVAGGCIAVFAGRLFPDVPDALIRQFRLSFVILLCAAAATLTSNVVWGYAMGVRRLRVPILLMGAGRAVALAAMAITAAVTPNVALISLAYAVPVVLALPLQAAAVRLRSSDFGREFRIARAEHRRAYLRSIRTLSIWSMGMIMISGLDATVVGRWDFPRTGIYVLAASLATVIMGGASSWQPAFLALVSRRDQAKGPEGVLEASRLSFVANVVVLAATAPAAWLGLQLLLPVNDARLGYDIFITLMAALVLRQFAAPAVLWAVARQRFEGLTLPALTEGTINLAASAWLCATVGAYGAALGTLLGTVALVPVVLFHSFSQEALMELDRAEFARLVLRRPIGILGLPLLATAAAPSVLPAILILPAQLLALLAVAALAFCVLLNAGDRVLARGLLRRSG